MASKDHPPTTLRRPSEDGLNLNSKQLTVVVGKGDATRTFYLHEQLATEHSSFFAAALHKGWKEAQERTTHLPDDSPAYFEAFARFIYSGKLYTCVKGDRAKVGCDNEWGRLQDCWVLGDKLGSVTFKDAVVDAICDKINSTGNAPSDTFPTVYAKSSSSAPVRRLMVDIAVWKWSVKTMRESKLAEPWKEFFKDLAVKLFELSEAERKGPAPFKDPGCKYHEHVVGSSPCYKTMY